MEGSAHCVRPLLLVCQKGQGKRCVIETSQCQSVPFGLYCEREIQTPEGGRDEPSQVCWRSLQVKSVKQVNHVYLLSLIQRVDCLIQKALMRALSIAVLLGRP